MRKIDKKNKIITIIILLPLLFIAQYYMFKLGIISPLIKGVDIKIIEGVAVKWKYTRLRSYWNETAWIRFHR